MYRKATTNDVEYIHKLINSFASKDVMLPRSLSEIYENLRDYTVYLDDNKVMGCVALHVYWEDLAEIRSVAVEEAFQRRGIATKLTNICMKECQDLQIKRMFVLTDVPLFFEKCGFYRITKDELPHKIWTECVRCHKFPGCTEIPLMLQC